TRAPCDISEPILFLKRRAEPVSTSSENALGYCFNCVFQSKPLNALSTECVRQAKNVCLTRSWFVIVDEMHVMSGKLGRSGCVWPAALFPPNDPRKTVLTTPPTELVYRQDKVRAYATFRK
ncbi:MAG TPA: hypothetical protein P5114_14240, partial [Hyphomicrobiaceae bacterium]|nr:hypothetical protein [Hyphomicrobiaceae bacterium]